MARSTGKARPFFFICGILAPVLYLGIDVLAGTLLVGYSFISQSLSDLSASSAPTRQLEVLLQVLFNLLMVMFGWGLWKVGNQKRGLRISGIMVIGNAVISTVAVVFFPWQLGAPASLPANTINTITLFFGMLCFLLAMGFGGAAFRNWFRVYSFGTLLTYLGLCVVGLILASLVPALQGMPMIGIQERTMVYAFLLWVTVLAIMQLRAGRIPPHLPTIWSSQQSK